MEDKYVDELSISEKDAARLICPHALGSSLGGPDHLRCWAPACPAWMQDESRPGFGFCTEFGAGKIAWFCATLEEAIEEALKAFAKGLVEGEPDPEVEAPELKSGG